LAEHSQRPSKQKPIKNFGKKGAWTYAGTAEIIWVPPIISGTGKLRTSNLLRIFIASVGRKAIKNFGKSSRGHIWLESTENVQGTDI